MRRYRPRFAPEPPGDSKFIATFESLYLLCYLRGPAGIIVALAEQIG